MGSLVAVAQGDGLPEGPALGTVYARTHTHMHPIIESSSLFLSVSLYSTLLYSSSAAGCEGESNLSMWIYVLLGNVLRGIGETPVQPLGISYIDDFAAEENAALYVGEGNKS